MIEFKDAQDSLLLWGACLTKLIAVSLVLLAILVPAISSEEINVDPSTVRLKENSAAYDIASNEFNSPLNYSYEVMDHHVLKKKPPASVKKSVKKLSAFLTAPAKNDREKARALYRWITQNIDYDVEGYFSNKYENTSPDNVLEERKSVCGGYANLFEAMAKEANLTVVIIRGYGKGIGYSPGAKIGNKTNHAWNAVRINGSWYLIDSTWGAGSVDEEGHFHRQFDEHYFLTPPSRFVYDHFPDDQRWQLLNNPISKEEFERFVYLKSDYFRYGLLLGNQNNSTIKSEGEANISIFTPANVLLTAALFEENENSSNLTWEDTHTFVERGNGRYDILVKAPHPGIYTLTIFGKRAEDQGKYTDVMEYKLEASSGSKDGNSFPIASNKFIETGCYLYQPMVRDLISGVPQIFKIKVPKALAVAVINGEDWTKLIKQGDIFEGDVTPSKGKIKVVAKFDAKTNYYESMLRYMAI